MPLPLTDPSSPPTANVALVRDLYAAYLERDVERLFPMLHPDVELLGEPGEGDETIVVHGREDLPRYQEQRDREYDVVRERVSEILDLGDGRVLAIGRILLAAPGQRRGFSSLFSWVIDIEGGVVTRVCGYVDQEEARAAVGLSEGAWPDTERYLGDLADGGAASRA